jgi:hypothetical protein
MEYSNDNGMEYEVDYALSGGCNRFFSMLVVLEIWLKEIIAHVFLEARAAVFFFHRRAGHLISKTNFIKCSTISYLIGLIPSDLLIIILLL